MRKPPRAVVLAIALLGIVLAFLLSQRLPSRQPASLALAPSSPPIPTHVVVGTATPSLAAPAAMPASQEAPKAKSHGDRSGRRVATDVPYCDARPGAAPHLTSLDIYSPVGQRDLPVLIYVHGGAWMSGDNDTVGAKANYFAGQGFVFVSVNYRLVPAAGPAEQATDLAEAVAWIKDHIAAYGGDGNRLFLLGYSAGAHLSALLASDETYLRGAGLDLAALRGVILLDSMAYDVEQLMCSPDGQWEVLKQVFGTDPNRWRRVSPRAHVSPDKGIPPHLLLLASAIGQRRPAAEGLASALRAARVYAHVTDASAFRDHTTIDTELGHPDDTPTTAVQAFLNMLLAGPPKGLGGQEVLLPGPQ